MDAQLYERIKEKARHQGLSLNETIKNLLADSMGFKQPGDGKHREDFAEFCGVWTEEDLKEFNQTVKHFDRSTLNRSGVFFTNQKQKEAIREGKDQIDQGRHVINEELETDEDRWLSE